MSEEESESCSEMTEAIPGGVQLKETISDGSISTVVTKLDSTRLSGVAGISTVTEIKSDCSILTEIKSYSSKSREDVTSSSILTDDLPGSEFRFDVMRLLSWFVDGGQIKPSEYRFQLELNLKERYDSLVDLGKRKQLSLEEFSTSKRFSVVPSVLFFQNFVPHQTYKVNVRMTNLLHTTQNVAITSFPQPASTFKITYDSKSAKLRVAPGMSVVLKVEFRPEAKTDHSTCIELKTNSETFHVPIITLSTRPLLEMPDDIQLPGTSPKMETEWNIQVRNVGTLATEFTLSTEKPFSLSLNNVFLRPCEEVQVWVKCMSMSPGHFHSKLLVEFETGERMSSNVDCSCSNLKLCLSTSRLDFGHIPVGLQNTERLRIVNNSDRCIQFRWVKNESLKEDLRNIEKLKGCCDLIKDNEQRRGNLLKYQDLLSQECHEVIYQRIYEDEVSALQPANELFQFSSEVYEIEPMSGQVWAHDCTTIVVTFRPSQCRSYPQVAWCDMTGMDSRHGLTLHGQGVGPNFTLSVTRVCLDLYVCSSKTFEVYITNVGDISGAIVFPTQKLIFGGHISCSPEYAEVDPGISFKFTLRFRSEFLGDFSEQICFRVVESNEELGLVLSGCVRSVLLNFHLPVLDFGAVSFGFPVSKTLKFTSDSPDPVPFEIRIGGDGTETPVTHEDYLAIPHDQLKVPDCPCEFHVEPNKGVLQPGTCQSIKVTLICNRFRHFSSSLKFELLNLKSRSSLLPVQYKCEPCSLICKPELKVLDQAFIDHKYSHEIKLNVEPVGRRIAFQYAPPSKSDDRVQICLSPSKGVLASSMNIQVTIMARAVDSVEVPIGFHMLGEESIIDSSRLHITGCGPILSANSNCIDLGEVPLLVLGTKTLDIRNTSPIFAQITACFTKPSKFWSITPRDDTIPPLSNLQLTIGFTPEESGPYTNTLCIQGDHFRRMNIKVCATGVGYSIVTKPNILPDYDFGCVFTNSSTPFTITLHNYGAQTFNLFWSTKPDRTGALYRQPTGTSDPPTWKIAPSKFKLGPREEMEMKVDVFRETQGEERAEFYLMGFVSGDKMNLQNVLKTSWRVLFISSILRFTPEQLLFRVDHVSPELRCVESSDTLEVYNPTEDTLYTSIISQYPFYLSCDQGDMSKYHLITDQIDQDPCTTLTSCRISSDFDCRDLEYNPNFDLQKMSSDNSLETIYENTSRLKFPSDQLSQCTLNMPSTSMKQMLQDTAMQGAHFKIDSTEEVNRADSRSLVSSSLEKSSHSMSSGSLQTDIAMNLDKALMISLPHTSSKRQTKMCCVLEPKGRFKVNVHFDVDSCLESLNSYVVNDFVFFKYQGVENEDKIPLLAIVNYPTVALNPRLLDYQTVSLYQHQTMKVILTNHSPFPIEYNFSWSADEWEVSYAKCDDKFVKKFRHELKKYSDKGCWFQSQRQRVKKKVQPAVPKVQPPLPSSQMGAYVAAREPNGGNKYDPSEDAASFEEGQDPTDAIVIDPHLTLSEQLGEVNEKFVQTMSTINVHNQKYKMADYKKLVSMILDKRFQSTDTTTKVVNQILYILQPLYTDQDRQLYRMSYTDLKPESEYAEQRTILNTYFSFTPSHGTIGPHQTQIIEACFYPKYGVDITGKALCNITGGLTEELSIQASAHDVYYTVNPMLIDLKCVKFGQHHGKFKIFNKGQGPLSLDQSYLSIIKINPRVKLTFEMSTLPPHCSTCVAVEYTAHRVGHFQEHFHFIVAHHPPIRMLLVGFCTFPQAILRTQRSVLYPSLPRKHEYIAIGRYLRTCEHHTPVASTSQTRQSNLQNLLLRRLHGMSRMGIQMFPASNSRISMNSEVFGGHSEFLDSDWEVVTMDMIFPSTSLIQATLERASVSKYQLRTRTQHLATDQEYWPVKVAPYVVDLHNITVNEPRVYSIVLSNPTRIDSTLVLKGNQEYAYLGLTVQIRGDQILKRKNVQYLSIHFTPSKTVFRQQSQHVQYSFFLQVVEGLVIEILVKAIVCVPWLCLQPAKIDFKTVKVNCLYNKTFTIENKGLVKAHWKLMTNHGRNLAAKVEVPGLLFSHYEGALSPGDVQFVNVQVHSTSAISHDLDFFLKVDNSKDLIPLKVLSNLVEPSLFLTERKLDFGHRYPYSLEEGLFCDLHNKNLFPVEIILQYPTDKNAEYQNEVKLLDLLFYYYKKNHLLIPNTYDENNFTPVLEKFKKQMQVETSEWLSNLKRMEKDAQKLEELESDSPPIKEKLSSDLDLKDNKKIKKQVSRSNRLSRTSMHKRRSRSTISHKHVSSTMTIFETDGPGPLPETLVSDEEVKEYIDYLYENNLLQDPLGLYSTSLIEESTVAKPDVSRGVCIMCFSAPEIGGKLYATHLAKKLDLEYVDIDELMMEMLVSHVAGPGTELYVDTIDHIDSLYTKITAVSTADEIGISGTAKHHSPNICNKLDTIMSYDFPSTATTSVKKKSKRSAHSNTEPVGLNELLVLEELLSQLLIYEGGIPEKCVSSGIVIADLKSRIFTKPANLFLLLLRIVTSCVKNVHLVVFHDSKDSYETRQKELEELSNIYAEKVLKDKRKRLQSITHAKYLQLSNSDREIYMKILEERREEHETRGHKYEDHPAVATIEQEKEETPPKKKSRLKTKDKSSNVLNIPEIEEEPPTEAIILLNQVLAQFDLYQLFLEKIFKMAANWYPHMEDVQSLTQETSSVGGKSKGNVKSTQSKKNLNKKKNNKVSFSETSEPETKELVPIDLKGLPIFIVNMVHNRNSMLEALTGFYDNADLLDREKRSEELVLQRYQAPRLPNFWFLKRPETRTPDSVSSSFVHLKPMQPAFSLQSSVLASNTGDMITFSNGLGVSEVNMPDDRLSTTSTTSRSKISKRSKGKRDPDVLTVMPNPKTNFLETHLVKYTIEPHGTFPLQVYFSPTHVGPYEHYFEFAVNNSFNKYRIKCVGMCVIPDIVREPAVMYPKVVDMYSDLTVHNVYVMKREMFFFGYVLVTEPDSPSVTRQYAEFTIRNASDVSPVNINFFWKTERELEWKDEFGFDRSELFLQPQESKKWKVWTSPHEQGTRADQIVFCIDENPSAGIMKLVTNGIRADFLIEPTTIKFSNSLLYHSYSACIRLSNRSPVALHWSFQSASSDSSPLTTLVDLAQEMSTFKDIEISKLEGEIGPLQFENIKVTYRPITVDQEKLDLWIHVTDQHKQQLVLAPVPVAIAWESFDVAVDLELPHSEKQLDFGPVQYGTSVQRSIRVKNRGVFDLAFTVVGAEYYCAKGVSFHPKNMFTLDPSANELLPDKTIDVMVTAQTKDLEKEIELTREDILGVLVTDRSNKENLIAVIPIPVSIQVLTPRFRILPADELRFGALQLKETKMMHFQISNVGSFSFDFNFTLPTSKKSDNKADDLKINKTSPAVNHPTKNKSEPQFFFRIDEGLTMGPFFIHMKGGTVLPKELVLVTVLCSMDFLGSYTEDILCHISNEPPGFEPITLRLSAEGQLPQLRVDDLSFVFQEANVIYSSLEELTGFCEDFMTSYTLFSSKENSLLFANVPISESCHINLHLYNSSRVDTEVLMNVSTAGSDNVPVYAKVSGKASARKKDRPSPESSTQPKVDDIFELDDKEFVIPPRSLKKVQLSFKPALIEDYKGTLSIIVPGNPDAPPLTIDLQGQVIVPHITILKPIMDQDDNHTLTMSTTRVGMTTVESFQIQNPCNVLANVILEFIKNEANVFSVIPNKETVPLLLMDTGEIAYSTFVDLTPGRIAEFQVYFKPTTPGKFFGEINLFIRNNTYEKFVIHVIGIGHTDRILTQGLDVQPLQLPTTTKPPLIPTPTKPKSPEKKISQKQLSGEKDFRPPEVETQGGLVHNYRHDFGAFPVGQEMWHSFQLGNVSSDGTLRYVFSSDSSNVSVFPSVGHLGPGTSGTFVIELICHEPYRAMALINCTLTPIALDEPSEDNWNISFSTSRDVNILNAVVPKAVDSKRNSQLRLKEAESRRLLPKVKTGVSSNLTFISNQLSEPNYQVLSDKQQIPLRINVKYVSDYVEFVVSPAEWNFDVVPCYQVNTKQVKVSNTGRLPIHLNPSLELKRYGTISPAPTSELVAISSVPVQDDNNADSTPSGSMVGGGRAKSATHKKIKYTSSGSLSAREGGTRKNISTETFESGDTGSNNLELNSDDSESTIELLDDKDGGTIVDDKKYDIDRNEKVDKTDRDVDSGDKSYSGTVEDNATIEGSNESGDSSDEFWTPVACPFSISPSETIALDPGQSAFYLVKFRPTQDFIFDAQLTFHSTPSIQDSEADTDGHICNLLGTGSMPWVHLELSEADFATKVLATSKMSAPLRCLAFNVLGENEPHVMKLKITNVSPEELLYFWHQLPDHSGLPSAPLFECTESCEGSLEPGGFTWVSFTFHPLALGEFTSRWELHLPEDDIEEFQLVGVAREPQVCLNKNFVKLSTCFVGTSSSDTICIRNRESCDLSYKFIESSLFSEERKEVLHVISSSGVLKAKSSTTVWLKCSPTTSGEFHFNAQCSISHLKYPLKLCVTCEVLSMRVDVTLVSDQGETIELYPNEENVFNIGKMNILSPVLYEYEIRNTSNKAIIYTWSTESKNCKWIDVDIESPTGRMEPEDTLKDNIVLLANNNCVFDSLTLILDITLGPRYVIKLKGIAQDFPYKLWPKVVDFGSCLITGHEILSTEQSKEAPSLEQNITYVNCKNHTHEDLVIECYFEDTPYLHLGKEQSIPAETTGRIEFTFNPQEPRSYHEEVELVINGIYKETLEVKGKGVEIKVRLANGEKLVNFGRIKIGSPISEKKVNLINEGERSVSLTLDTCSKTESDNHSQCDETNVFQVIPRTLNLRAKETKSILIQFNPHKVQKNNDHYLVLNFEAVKKILCLIKGSVIGSKLFLDRPSIAFNPTQRTFTSVETLLLVNEGDIGVKYEWAMGQSGTYFRIRPARGYSKPGEVVHFSVEFTPTRPMLSVSCKAVCKLDKHAPLELTLAGSCVPLSKTEDTIEFSTPVRTKTSDYVKLETSAVITELSGNYFSGVRKVVEDRTEYHVTYAPMTMLIQDSKEEMFHTGYLKLRKGSDNFLYRLLGKPLPPLPNSTIVASLTARELFTQPLLAHNWLPYSQKFTCYYKLAPSVPPVSSGKSTHDKAKEVSTGRGSAKSKDKLNVKHAMKNLFSAKMTDVIFIPAHGERQMEFEITPYRSGKLNFHVILKNEMTKEYQWWDLHYEAVDDDEPADDIKLSTRVRQKLEYSIELDNPSEESTVFTANTSHPDVTVQENLTVPGKKKGVLKVTYLPLLEVDEDSASIEVTSPNLSRIVYSLTLTALAPSSERVSKFTAELGKSLTQVVEIENSSTRPKTEFLLEVSHPDFIVERSVHALQGMKTPVTITYEPTSLTGCQAGLRAKSLHAGEYNRETISQFYFSLIGEVLPPKPQGPYFITPGDSIAIPFKNIFHEPLTFYFLVDNPLFTLKSPSENIRNKKDTRITVSLSQSPDSGCSPTSVGKMTVGILDEAPEYVQMKWIFYLNAEC